MASRMEQKGAAQGDELPQRLLERTAELEAANEELRARNRRQSAVAALGQEAIRARDASRLVAEAVRLAARTLGTDFAAVLALDDDGRHLDVRAACGWEPDIVGRRLMTTGDGAGAAFVLRSDGPLIVADLRKETRFPPPPTLLRSGIRSSAVVIIRGRDRPWGTLAVHSRQVRPFTADDVDFLQSVANVLALAVERFEMEGERARLLAGESAARATAEAALDRLRAIDSITEPALAYMALEDLLRHLLARLREVLHTETAAVLLVDEDRSSLTVRAAEGSLTRETRVPMGALVSGRIADEGRAMIFNELPVSSAPEWKGWYKGPEVRAAMGAPLIVEGRVTGVVTVVSRRQRVFVEEDLALLRMVADRVAPAIERGRLGERVRAGRERLKLMSRRLLSAQEEERRRLAVELHDELGQVLTAVKINLAFLERLSGAAPAPAPLREAMASVDRAMDRVRDLALDLRPSVLDDLGLPAALRWYLDRFARDSQLEVHASIEAVPHLEPAIETACFRVAQEALTNVARHARARRVWVDLHLLAGGLELTVRDDGVGLDATAARERAVGGASIGLLGMQERIALAGGEFEIRPAPGGGTQVQARFPVGTRP